MQLSQTDLLATPVPPLSAAEAEAYAWDIYGLRARARELGGERDRNFHLLAADGGEFVLKLSNPAEAHDVIDFQTKALLHIEAADPALSVPRVLRTRDGATQRVVGGPAGGRQVLRVLTYVGGAPLNTVARTPALMAGIGDFLARLGLALRTFDHPASRHELLWDLTRAGRVRTLFDHAPAGRRGLLLLHLDRFEERVAPRLADLRAQVIHNDLNLQNVVVNPSRHDEIAGVYDFGDMIHAPLINDLAVAAAYQLACGDQPLEPVAAMAAAYHARRPLARLEVDLLPDLIATRMILTVSIGAWRSALHPQNRDYILRSNREAWAGLEALSRLDPEEARNRLRRACGMAGQR